MRRGKAVAIAQLCRWFGVPRSTFCYRPMTPDPRPAVLDSALVATIRKIIETEPAAGLRMITARLRRTSPAPINRKKVHRILKVNGWQVRQRPRGQRPRVQGRVSPAWCGPRRARRCSGATRTAASSTCPTSSSRPSGACVEREPYYSLSRMLCRLVAEGLAARSELDRPARRRMASRRRRRVA